MAKLCPSAQQIQKTRRRTLSNVVRFVVAFALMRAIYIIRNHIDKLNAKQITTLTSNASRNEAGYICWPPSRGHTARKKRTHEPKILVWTQIHYQWKLGLGEDKFTRFKCTGCRGGCYITNDRRELNESDAVLFHGKDINVTDMPLWRSPAQKWVYWSMEPPSYSNADALKQLKSTFNWTMTYRLDSDVLAYYGKVTKYKMPQPYDWEKLHEAWGRKSKMAVWAVSNCMTPSKRENYVSELKRHIAVDVYGFCGSKKCDRNSSIACYLAFSEVYYFYLSFENSVCKDYITEKLFQALKYDIIPVVYGGGNYSTIAPPGSYIDALRFSSPKDLADYMRDVASNYSLYAQYFQWKRAYQVSTNEFKTQSFCFLCHKLHSRSFKQKTLILDPFQWWVTKSQCRE